MSRARSMYNAKVIAIVEDGKDARGNKRYAITATDRMLDGTSVDRTARTRGWLDHEVAALSVGDFANLITDGRGSIIAIDKTGA